MGLSQNPAPASPMNIEADFSSLSNRAAAVIRGLGSAFFDIRDYGAAVDGVTDDSQAIKAAVEAAKLVYGGAIYFPAGETLSKTKWQVISNQGGNLRFVGNGDGSSRVHFSQMGADRGWSVSGWDLVQFENLNFIGDSAAGVSADTVEANYPPLFLEGNYRTVFRRCQWFGIKVLLGGLIYLRQTKTIFEDCFFGACCSPAQGVVHIDENYGTTFRRVDWIDYHQFGGVFWNKLGVGNTASWVKFENSLAAANGGMYPLIFEGCHMDENNTAGLLNLTGSGLDSVDISNSSFASGFGLGTALFFENFQEVAMRNVIIGLGLNTSDHRSALFTDVETVRMENYNQLYGAKYLTLDGVTEFVSRGKCELQGTVAFPTGIEDLGSATVTAYK